MCWCRNIQDLLQRVACMSAKSDTIATESKTATRSLCESDIDSGGEFENDDESL